MHSCTSLTRPESPRGTNSKYHMLYYFQHLKYLHYFETKVQPDYYIIKHLFFFQLKIICSLFEIVEVQNLVF